MSTPTPASTTVDVHLFAAARAAVGAGEVQAIPGTLESILLELAEQHPAFAPVRARCSFLVDGLVVHGDLGYVNVAAGQRVDVLPPFAGG